MPWARAQKPVDASSFCGVGRRFPGSAQTIRGEICSTRMSRFSLPVLIPALAVTSAPGQRGRDRDHGGEIPAGIVADLARPDKEVTELGADTAQEQGKCFRGVDGAAAADGNQRVDAERLPFRGDLLDLVVGDAGPYVVQPRHDRGRA